ncbi:hypothetical protein EDB85DRAFT_2147632 [Lactarius pseudohatsudake]|nr:hypothetical protein EDB85DRAFT_2147632 [Lactarius pseudohatsudake]
MSNDTPALDRCQPAFGTTTPTPNRGVRRQRDSDDFENNMDSDFITRPSGAPFTPGTTKRLKTTSDEIARQYDVDPAQLREFANSQSLPEMVLRFAGCILKLEKQFSMNEFDALLKSQEFRVNFSFNFAVQPFSADVLPDWFIGLTLGFPPFPWHTRRVIRDQQRIFKVPKEILEDPDYCSRLETTVSELLTTCRSNIKQKIEASFRDNGDAIHISVLAVRLFPKGIQSTTAHWTRIAFLRSAFRDFVRFSGLKKPVGALCELRKRNPTDNLTGVAGPGDDTSDTPSQADNDGRNVDNSGWNNEDSEDDPDPSGPITKKQYTHQQFWNYVDDYLEFIRMDLFRDIADRTERNSNIIHLFNNGLQTDIFNYREGRKPPPSGDQLPAWQETLHRSACW